VDGRPLEEIRREELRCPPSPESYPSSPCRASCRGSSRAGAREA
jgi:hypothetical protein